MMRRFLPSKKFLRVWLGVLAAAILILPTLGATGTDNSTRFDKVGHQLMCTCSCGQILVECNHVGCPNSDGMRQELATAVASGATDQQIYDIFIRKYGPTVMAAPLFHGFNILAWILPIAALLVGTLGAALLLNHWRRRNLRLASASGAPSVPPTPTDAMRDRIRRETQE
jgi:cytochrome c-type biogenesis protein CcmH